MALIMGVDPAFGKPTVWAIYETANVGGKERGNVVRVGEVASPSGMAIVMMTEKPDLVVVEKAWVGRNIDSALKLGRAIGWIEAFSDADGIAFSLVHPATWKAWAQLPRSKRAPHYMSALLSIARAWTSDALKAEKWFEKRNADDYACAILIASFAGNVLWDGNAKSEKN